MSPKRMGLLFYMLISIFLQTGIESLREWFASDVLQPLQAAFEQAHADVIAGAAQLGFAGVRLTPLTELGTLNCDGICRGANHTYTLINT